MKFNDLNTLPRLHYIYIYIIISIALISCSSSKKIHENPGVTIETFSSPDTTQKVATKTYTPIQLKYSKELHTDPSYIQNQNLYSFIDYWIGTPYLWGGTTKKGIDCSAFIQKLLVNVYSIRLPRTSIEQFYDDYVDLFASTRKLAEGDLVFFKTMPDKTVSHVGVYLRNGMFVNSSSSKGVSIASLRDPYWESKYVAAGRVKQSMASGQ